MEGIKTYDGWICRVSVIVSRLRHRPLKVAQAMRSGCEPQESDARKARWDKVCESNRLGHWY